MVSYVKNVRGVFLTKILVISDTHRNISSAVDIIEDKNPDYVLHLGDMSDDCDELSYMYPRINVVGVRGNCDWQTLSNAPLERMLDIEGVKILMCHGHSYSVKKGIGAYCAVASVKGAHIALFGHTHVPLIEQIGDSLLINPGTVSTYAWIEVSNGKFNATLHKVGD